MRVNRGRAWLVSDAVDVIRVDGSQAEDMAPTVWAGGVFPLRAVIGRRAGLTTRSLEDLWGATGGRTPSNKGYICVKANPPPLLQVQRLKI